MLLSSMATRTLPSPTQPHPLRLFRAILTCFALLLAPGVVTAGMDHSLQSFAETGYTGYVISSDKDNPNPLYERDAIRARVSLQYTRTGPSDHHYEYRFNFQLLNQAGVAQTLNLGGASTGTTLTVWQDVNLTNLANPTIIATTGRVIPAGRLNPNENHQVRVTVARRLVAPLAITSGTLITAETPLAAYRHFDQLTSGDVPYNIISDVTSVTLSRVARVRTDIANDYFQVNANVRLHRYDAFAAGASTQISTGTRLVVVMRDDLGNVIPLQANTFNFDQSVASFFEADVVTPRRPATSNASRVLQLRPVNQLLSRSRTYSVQVSAGHFETPGAAFPVAGGSRTTDLARLLDFNGTLSVSGTNASFTSIALPLPLAGSLGANHVVTSLRINNNSGSFQGLTFGNGSELPVHLLDSGAAQLAGGSLNLNGVGMPLNPGGIPYTLENVVVSPSSITGLVRLQLPSGLGVADTAETRIHNSTVSFPGTPLTSQFKPVAATLTSSASRWAAEESKPFVFKSSALHWDVDAARIRFTATGEARFVRADAYHTLLNELAVDPGQRIKLANDGYYLDLNAVTSPEVTITADAGNGSALMTCNLSMGGAIYRGHFPHDMLVISGGGTQRIVNDRVDTAFGGLSVNIVQVSYRRDCPGAGCGIPAGTDTLTFNPAGNRLAFTRDGGLAASGTLAVPKNINWGWIATANDFAHAAKNFTVAGFHASGNFLASADLGNAATEPEVQPARLLFTGINPGAANTVERPGTAAYKAGLGDYAGLNFRVADWGAKNGKLVLAGKQSPPFPLTNRAKYIVRRAGVTGIHEAVNGQFAPTAIIYGMDFEFTTLGWAFLDGGPIASRTNGNLTVPYPSDFNLGFEEVRLTCQGGLEGADIAAADSGTLKKLSYWNADFRPLTLSFEGKEALACDPSSRSLVLGVETYAGGIQEGLAGRIGFQTNGNLITRKSKELDDFDSRFRLPNTFGVAGPGGQSYRATSVGEAYLNDYAAFTGGPGWMNFAAHLDIPFFSDLEVHLHTTAVKNDEAALYHVMGGYPDAGFSENKRHYFNEAVFDVSNRGFPLDVSLAQYRALANAKYRPYAFKRWLNVINLDYPLQWRPASRSFVSYADSTEKFLVLYASHRIDYLSPDFVEVSFGGSASLLPKINIANFVADKATDVTAVLKQKLKTKIVDDGIKGLNEILDVKQRDFFEHALAPAVKIAVDSVMATIHGNWNADNKTWVSQDLSEVINNGLLHGTTGIGAQVRAKLSAVSNAAGVLQEIDARLLLAQNALTTIEAFIQKKDGEPLGDLQSTVVNLASLVSGALDKPEFAEKIKALMERAEPRIAEIRLAIAEVRGFITKVRTSIGAGGDFAAQVASLVTVSGASIDAAATLVGKDIEKILKEIRTGLDSLPQQDAAIREKIRQRINDYVLGLPVIAQFNRLVKQRLYDAGAQVTEAIDEVFDQINLTLRDIIREVAGGLDQKFEEMVGEIASVMATADINGYAKVRNDSLTELRLDLKAKMSVPDDMKAHVFLLIRELNSENSPASCLPETGKATEITMGAKDIAVEWLFPGTIVSIQAKFLLDGNQQGTPLMGMGGGFDLKGEISFGEQVKIRQLGASVMFSSEEAYLSAAAKIEVQGFAGGGGIFLGKTCSIEPFFWDETVGSVLGEPPFTGMYGYGEFWIPIPTLIGIPSTCLFNLSAGVGAGAGFFLEGPTVFGKMFLGVSGDVLCIVSITGEISLVGVARPSGLSMAGEGRFKAAIGWCPLCIKFDKMIRLTRERGKWGRSIK